MTAAIEIRPYEASDQTAVGALIVGIQQGEFGFSITLEDQPDLIDIEGFYGHGAGAFWVAVADGRVVGTVGLRDIGGGNGALRKMFVAAPMRGAKRNIAAALLDALLAHARQRGLTTILLGTARAFNAAHRFYEKHGFGRITMDDLPPSFPRMDPDEYLYRLVL